MAREKVGDTDADNTVEEAEDIPAEDAPAKEAPIKQTVAKKAPTKKTAAKKAPTKKTAGKKARPESATAKQAAAARATMQRQHRRIEFWRAAAAGAEGAGAAGAVVAGFLVWEWTDRLWGRTDQFGLVTQIAIAVVVLVLVAAWVLRDDRWRIGLRTLVLAAAALVAGLGIGAVWTAEAGARGPGGLVAAVAAVLVLVGSVGWLLALRQLRKLFAFGVGYARSGGYGNLAAVHRARLLGAPAGAVGVAVVVTGALVVVPGWISTEDATTAEALVLTGEPPTSVTAAWEIELPAGATNSTVRATVGGLVVDEPHGVRMVDPASGETRWHWRDESYNRVAVALAEEQRLLVLGLDYDGETNGRDRLVALDTSTGEVQWDRFDDDVVTAMATLGVASRDGTWLAVPDSFQANPQAEADPTAPDSPIGVHLIDLTTGETSWRDAGTEGCRVSSIGAGSPDAVVLVERCPPPAESQSGDETCQVAGLSVEDGSRMWDWPAGDERIDAEQQYVTDCRANTLADTVFLNYQVTDFAFEPGAPVEQTPALALDPRTGEEIWVVEREEDSYAHLGVDGLSDLREVVGGRTVGVEWPSGQAGQGAAALILRDMADGSRIGEVVLPEGQPVAVRPAGDDTLMLTHYNVEADQILLLEVDLTAQAVVAETLVGSGSETAQFRSAGLATGPGLVAVDTLVAPGAEAAPEDSKLVVHGYGPS